MKNNDELVKLQAQAEYLRFYIKGFLDQYWQLCEQIADASMGGAIGGMNEGRSTSRKEISSNLHSVKEKK